MPLRHVRRVRILESDGGGYLLQLEDGRYVDLTYKKEQIFKRMVGVKMEVTEAVYSRARKEWSLHLAWGE